MDSGFNFNFRKNCLAYKNVMCVTPMLGERSSDRLNEPQNNVVFGLGYSAHTLP